MSSYQYVSVNKNPLFAYSTDAPRWLFQQGVGTLLPLSVKRRVTQRVLNIAHRLKLDKYLSRPIAELTDFPADCDAISKALDPQPNRKILIIFRVPMQNNLCYAHVYDDQRRLIEFVKVGLDAMTQDSLQCEADNMEAARRGGFADFQIPKLIACEQHEGFSVLRTQAITDIDHRCPLVVKHIIEQYRNTIWPQTKTPQSLEQSSWWQDFVERRELTPALFEYLNANKSKQYQACTTHGDLRRQNIITTADQQLYLVDWEHFTADGPYLSDVIALLTQYHKDLSAANIATYLQDHYQLSQAISDWEISCALAFLSSRNRFRKPNHYGMLLGVVSQR